MNDKAPIDDWLRLLSKYYKRAYLRRLYFTHKGSYNELVLLYSEKVLHSRGIKRSLKCRKANSPFKSFGNGHIIIKMEDVRFNKFFKDINMYIADIGITDSKLDRLEVILRTYYYEYLKTKRLNELIKKDSIQKREEAIKNILDQARDILRIMGYEHHNTIPKEVKIKTIGELNKETIELLKSSSIRPSSTYGTLLKDIRKI